MTWRKNLPLRRVWDVWFWGRPSQGDATEGKGTGMKSDLLPAGLTLFANKLNGFELLQSPFGDTNGRQN
jgi:hypothetical protein